MFVYLLYIYIYVHVCVYIHIYIYTCMCIYVDTYIRFESTRCRGRRCKLWLQHWAGACAVAQTLQEYGFGF